MAPVIGLTGGIATGKTTVAEILRELGARIVDADIVARDVVAVGEPAWHEIVDTYGPAALNPDRTVNRRRLGDMVFGRPEALSRLNSIIHPRVLQRIAGDIATFRRQPDGAALVVVAPLLIEAGMCDMVDEVWLVTLDQEEQVERLMRRDRFTLQQAINRLTAQMPQAEKKKHAHRLIDNSHDFDYTKKQVEELWSIVTGPTA